MLKKRLVFTLLYNNGKFALSRNFRLQNVGDLSWLIKNYNFKETALHIDELVVLDVTRGSRNLNEFCTMLRSLSEFCFMPISAGGGIASLNHVDALFRNGADKIVINSAIYDRTELLREIAIKYGRQSIIGSFDLKKNDSEKYELWTQSNSLMVSEDAQEFLKSIDFSLFGEIYLNSIERDGTGNGFDLQLLEQLPFGINIPTIIAGGAGNSGHFISALMDKFVDAAATANLLNFIGDGLIKTRNELIISGFPLANW